MADALCGPSNALQNFQKHTTVDRTLQQERFASRPRFEQVNQLSRIFVYFLTNCEQGFRTSPGPNAGILDAEFEAFQAGRLGGGLLDQPFSPVPFQEQHVPMTAENALPSWAADFQSMHLSDVRASPVPQSQFRREAPILHTAPGGWHQEFMRQGSPSAVDLPHQQTGYNSSHRNVWPNSYNAPSQAHMPSIRAQQKQPEMQNVEDLLNQEEMERAFEAASMEYREVTEAPSSILDVGKELQEMDPYQERIGSDRILEESMKRDEDNIDNDDADELARTAGQLLDNVRHDQSQKFQQSSFLSLMRQLRDREVQVEGDKLVDVSLSHFHS